MGEILVEGPGAMAAVDSVITNNIAKLKPNRAFYAALCYPDGGTVDDLFIYKFDDNKFLLCVNASNIEKDYAHIIEHIGDRAVVTNLSNFFAQIAIQGSKAEDILQRLTSFKLSQLKYFDFVEEKVLGLTTIISRTGYTGEDGFEIYFDGREAPRVWNELLIKGRREKIKPIGLGARDTLRLEMGYSLYGHELSDEINPLMANIGFAVDLKKTDFVGRDALIKARDAGIRRQIVGFVLDDGIARRGYKLYNKNVQEVGEITSGSYSPMLKASIGLGLVDIAFNPEEELLVSIRGKYQKAVIVKLPFYTSRVKR
jgi:aminomethyltransferase